MLFVSGGLYLSCSYTRSVFTQQLLYLYSIDGLYFEGNDFIEGQIMDDGSSNEWAKENSKDKKMLKLMHTTAFIYCSNMVCNLIFYLFVYK